MSVNPKFVTVPFEPTEAMIFCLFGERISDESHKIRVAAYQNALLQWATIGAPGMATWYDTNEPDSLDERGPHD